MLRSARSLLSKSFAAHRFTNSVTLGSPPLHRIPATFPPSKRPLYILPTPRFRLYGESHLGKRVGNARSLCANEPVDYSKEVDEINLKFAEAREEIEAAMESKETVYFDEEAECARKAVKAVLDMFEGLLARLPEQQRTPLQRSMGLKIEQLKAELNQLDD